jgi:DNA repair protein RadD
MILREYQQRSIDELYRWFGDGGKGNPCMVLPTGSGKSHIVAALCKDAVQNWPETRVLMLTHVRELIAQNAEKMRQHWPGAPLGIYSAGLKQRNLAEPITFAGIQSVRNRAVQIGHVDLIIVDECHLIGHKDAGGYRDLIGELLIINPMLRVIGLTATPYRLGHGMITDKPAIFDALIEPVTIQELIHKGYLAVLRSKVTKEKLSTEGLKKRGGEYIESEMQAAFDTSDHNMAVVDEVISLAGDRKSWLFFCAGVEHAEHIAEELNARGVVAACLTGDTPPAERDEVIKNFKSGAIRALTNVNVLTTGFDYPDIDLIAMLRATMSPVLYVQMAGRGLRPKSHTDHCLVLDFAGVVETHGPITAVKPPNKNKGDGTGEAPVKACDSCGELVHISAKECPACEALFPEPEKQKLELRDVDIMGTELDDMNINITEWRWRKHTSRASGKLMIAVDYYGGLSDPVITEYFPITHDGYAGTAAAQKLAAIANRCGAASAMSCSDLDDICRGMQMGDKPKKINYKKDGKYFRVTRRDFGGHLHVS